MAARIRRNVYSLADEAPALVWYRRAVGALKLLPRSQIGSWEYMAACHGIPNNVPTPPGAANLWRQCQHQTWFFLPWHRGYLAGFEAVVAAQVKKLGGPATWSLPYWNYSDTANPRARQLPPAFRRQLMPNGSPNHLWAPRNAPAVPGGALTLAPSDVTLGALNTANFISGPGGIPPGFGGPQTGFSHFGSSNGALETRPHNVVHGAIGGLMNNPNSAALDPVFWLHHCNIDRLWERWRRMVTPVRDPSAAQWLTGVSFKLVKDGGASFNFTSSAARNTVALLHGYRYDSVLPVIPPMISAAPAVRGTEAASMAADEAVSELIGASGAPVKLGAVQAEAMIRRGPAAGGARALADAPAHRRHYVSLEGVTAKGVARDYKVFLDLSTDDRVPLEIGILATFGIGNASEPGGPHGGSGLTQVFDVTDAVDELGAAAMSSDNLRVTFEPIQRGALEEVPDAYEYAEMMSRTPVDLVIGRVSLYSQ
jgi:tyrosinase